MLLQIDFYRVVLKIQCTHLCSHPKFEFGFWLVSHNLWTEVFFILHKLWTAVFFPVLLKLWTAVFFRSAQAVNGSFFRCAQAVDGRFFCFFVFLSFCTSCGHPLLIRLAQAVDNRFCFVRHKLWTPAFASSGKSCRDLLLFPPAKTLDTRFRRNYTIYTL